MKKKKFQKSRSLVELVDVWKTYHLGSSEVHALSHVNLTIYPGEFLALLGPSGSGKSTLMHLVGCLDLPSKGKIYLDGKDISQLSESALAQIRGRKIGFIFQQFNLIPTLTALENVMLPMAFQGVPSDEREERARELLHLVDLGPRMHHKPSELSGGQQQRVAIARSLANQPEIILADEPTGNLDSKTGNSVMSFLQKLHDEKGTTVIVVTHDVDLAAYAKRKEFLKDGVIVKSVQR